MDQNNKAWLWRKKSREKSERRMIDKVNLSLTRNEEEIQTLMTAKSELEKDLKSSNDKLSACLSEFNTKDGTIKKHVKMAEEAMAGWEKAEANAATLKKELDTVLQQRAAREERLTHLEGALKECMRQLHFVRNEQEQRIHDAVMKASTEFEMSEKILEDKLVETSQRNAKLVAEITQLRKTLLAKEKSNEDLIKQKAQVETNLNALMSRLESTEKENASLKYEVRVLEKELEIRNEEREFNRRTAEASHKQHLDSVKKIAKLESECQRLRVLVRKRLPGPAALAKMRSEVDVLGRDSAGRRKTKSDVNSLDTCNKQISFLTEQLCAMEEENNSLKEALDKKANELQVSRTMYARTASKLSQIESHIDELSKVQTRRGPSVLAPNEQLRASMSDVGSDDKISCAESWASALISELEHFKHGKQRDSPSGKTVGASDISLMDDFAEMERLAIVSIDNQSRTPHVSCNDAKTAINGHGSVVTGKEIVPFSEITSGISIWLDDILKMVMEQAQRTQRKPYEVLEDVRVVLAESEKQIDASNSANVGKNVSMTPTNKYILMDSSRGMNDDDDTLLVDRKNSHKQTDLEKSILKIIELVEGITLPRYGSLETSSEYAVRVFQWKTSELGDLLQKFVHACYDLLNGKSDVISFARELASSLDWVMNHCFSFQDVSSMEDAIKKHLDFDETRNGSEAEVGLISQPEVNKICLVYEPSLYLPVGKEELNEAHQKFSSLEMELENKQSRCDELEATCLDLQLQLESVRKNTIPGQEEEKQLRSDLEVTAASEKLAECQETILNLGKQLKALATQSDASMLDTETTDATVATTTTSTTPMTPTKLMKQRSSLLDQMLAEDKAKTRDSGSKSPKMKQGDYKKSVSVSNEAIEPLEKILALNESKRQGDNVATTSLAIVPSKKPGANLWRKLLWRKKKSNIRRPPVLFTP